MANAPRIVLWDVETSHNLVAAFSLKNQDWIPATNIVRERNVICASWKELQKPRISAVSVLDDKARFKKNPHDDYHVLKVLHEVLSGADVIVAHNGDRFDIKFTEARMIIQGFPPLPPILKIDTLKVARNRFLFNANNLDYLGKVLGVGQKRSTSPGLWLRVLAGDPRAVRQMVAYNKQDVRLLEDVFLKLRPYMPDYVNRQLFGYTGTACPRCGSQHTQARGVHRSITQVYTRYQCQDCSGWFRNRLADKTRVPHRVL